mmetsp:Transcript_103373/g.318954  ORF Transcript_103373/g.318954 Transcript_103373/m.318954 type:complete len:110 (-) Transcript_103373:369-698(-)
MLKMELDPDNLVPCCAPSPCRLPDASLSLMDSGLASVVVVPGRVVVGAGTSWVVVCVEVASVEVVVVEGLVVVVTVASCVVVRRVEAEVEEGLAVSSSAWQGKFTSCTA